ncbi:MAG TPA: M15 family metallopeptidase [Rhodopseudomonas sp.]|uniref:M15 family metallopeptidase n=1 Tax=Rhodopseudomonas sp. TaxID=1078 RepID=UPI002EDB1566
MEKAVLRNFARIVVGLFAAALSVPAAAQPLPDDLVLLRAIDPSIQQDLRYAGVNNFMGRRIAGYDGAECVVKRPVGLGLREVQRELRGQNLSLKMLDCYRPVRASRDMVAWAQDGRETAFERRYNPGFSKRELFRLGYIAERSGHSTGAAVDLTLVDLTAPRGPAFDPAKAYADCTAPEALRAPEGAVEMGTGYDCSDAKAHTASRAITPRQRQWRDTLNAAMARHGFVNYAKEWWHFSRPGMGDLQAYDFAVPGRRGN